jgi:hypothetical protein
MDLILFYKTENSDDWADFLRVSNSPIGTQRGVYFIGIKDDDIDYYVTKMACDNMQQTYSRSLRPTYFEINPDYLLKIPKLLAFA